MFFYCPACKKNLQGDQRKHNFTRGHVAHRDEFLEKATQKVDDAKFFLKNVMVSKVPEPPWRCDFCEEDVDNSKNQTIW
jgi:hypothetical protein